MPNRRSTRRLRPRQRHLISTGQQENPFHIRSKSSVPDEELHEGSCLLVHGHVERFNVEFKENARSAGVVVKNPRVVGHAVLVCLERFRTRCNIRGGNDGQEVLVCDKSCE